MDARGAVIVTLAACAAFGCIEHGAVCERDQNREVHNTVHLGRIMVGHLAVALVLPVHDIMRREIDGDGHG